MKFKPGRMLNDSSAFFGLGIVDLAGLGYLLVTVNQFLQPLGFEVFSFVIVAFFSLALIRIRNLGRKKVIRDSITYYFRRIRP